MSGRHRRPLPSRRVTRRVIAAGAAGLSAAFALAPLALADPVAPTSSSAPAPDPASAPASDAPTTDAPSSDAPSSPDPTTSASSSSAPSSTAPTSTAPTSTAPTSSAPTSPSTSTTAPAPGPWTVAPAAPLAGDFGFQKYRVGVQLKTGAYVPPGTTTVGSVVHVVAKQDDGTVDLDTTCTTDTPDSTVATTSYCSSAPSGPGSDTITLTQISAPAGLTVDPISQQVPPCTNPILIIGPPGFCPSGPYVFTDNGLAPQTSDDTGTVRTGGTVDVPVLENDDLHGAPLTGMDVSTAPQHGTASVVPPVTPPTAGLRQAAATGPSTPVIRYVPAAGFVGTDSLQYTITTPNGPATGTLQITVLAPPPTANDDAATTTENHPVTIDVTANDAANGGGTLSVTTVGTPAHGTARRSGTDVVYTPARGFSGTDHFTYVVTTGGGSDTATVTVRVRAAQTSSSAPSTPAAPTTTDNGTGDVANTGADSAGLLTLGGGLLLAGGAVTVAGGRRRRRAH